MKGIVAMEVFPAIFLHGLFPINILWSGCQLLLHMKSIIIFDFNLFDGEMILHWPK